MANLDVALSVVWQLSPCSQDMFRKSRVRQGLVYVKNDRRFPETLPNPSENLPGPLLGGFSEGVGRVSVCLEGEPVPGEPWTF